MAESEVTVTSKCQVLARAGARLFSLHGGSSGVALRHTALRQCLVARKRAQIHREVIFACVREPLCAPRPTSSERVPATVAKFANFVRRDGPTAAPAAPALAAAPAAPALKIEVT